jgi:hypothetical protein
MSDAMLRECAGWAGYALASYPPCGGDPEDDVENLISSLVIFLRLRGYSEQQTMTTVLKGVESAGWMIGDGNNSPDAD